VAEREFQIREGDSMPNGLSFLGPIGVIGEAIAAIVNPAYNRPLTTILGIGAGAPAAAAPAPMIPRSIPSLPASYQLASYAAPGTAITIPPQTRMLARRAGQWALRMIRQYGPIIGYAIVNDAQQRQQQGLAVRDSHEAAEYTHAGTVTRKGRRMNPTNIRALRRAVRRVRSFQKTTRKVRGLFPAGRAAHRVRHYVRHRRGDVDPFAAEDAADYYDTVEDLGYEPSSFRDDEDGE